MQFLLGKRHSLKILSRGLTVGVEGEARVHVIRALQTCTLSLQSFVFRHLSTQQKSVAAETRRNTDQQEQKTTKKKTKTTFPSVEHM